MDKNRKREMLREYKERKQQQGVYAVRCAATGAVWTAVSRNLDKQHNTTWFQLRQGGHPNKAMQAAWNAHGEAAFAYEILEEVKDDNPLLIASLLKDREVQWRKELNAEKAVG
ncbi:MAG: GIY-YIG nuclease family protein [Proteobacteria bacterium]|nr:GIY-YIG nuclease family protein [Pseudomonadota bacterium]